MSHDGKKHERRIFKPFIIVLLLLVAGFLQRESKAFVCWDCLSTSHSEQWRSGMGASASIPLAPASRDTITSFQSRELLPQPHTHRWEILSHSSHSAYEGICNAITKSCVLHVSPFQTNDSIYESSAGLRDYIRNEIQKGQRKPEQVSRQLTEFYQTPRKDRDPYPEIYWNSMTPHRGTAGTK